MIVALWLLLLTMDASVVVYWLIIGGGKLWQTFGEFDFMEVGYAY